MTNPDLEKLKELAERATPRGPWKTWVNPMRDDGRFVVPDQAPMPTGFRNLDGVEYMKTVPAVIPIQLPTELAEYIAAVSPDVVLDLITSSEALMECVDKVITLQNQLTEAREVIKVYVNQPLNGYAVDYLEKYTEKK